MFQQGDGVRLTVDLLRYPHSPWSSPKIYAKGDTLTVVRTKGLRCMWDYWCSGSNGEVGVAAHEIEEVQA